MKTRDQIESRLKKLRMRYVHKHVEATQQRCFNNCTFNQIHTPKPLHYGPVATEYELSPRLQTTLIVLNEDRTVHLCMYGVQDKATWSGDTCDTDDKAKCCPMFKPRVTLEQARADFMNKLSDDEYVFDNFRDVATLQWVLGERVHEVPLTLFERFLFWLKVKFWKPAPALPQISDPELASDLWYDKTNDSSAPP